MIGLLELLARRGFSAEKRKVKLVRHKDARFDLETLFSNGDLDRYQQFQGKPIFDGCTQIVSFIGEEGNKSRFIGVFDVGKGLSATSGKISDERDLLPWASEAKYWYPTRRRKEFADLENRVVIDWGGNARSWHQWFSDRTVLEIRPEGRSLPPFRDYLAVHLTFRELRHLVRQPDAHRDWVAGLKAVGGIYLIVSTLTGEQYVGSATGEAGIWARWSSYAKTGHCGNTKLVELCTDKSNYPDAFMFSILEVFSRTTAKQVALKQEQFFKEKLGTHAFGLNEN